MHHSKKPEKDSTCHAWHATYTRSMNTTRSRTRGLARMLTLLAGMLLLVARTARDEAPVVPAHRQASHATIITINGPIDSMTVQSVRRRLADAVDEGSDAIVIRLNTPGGELMSTLELCRMLKEDAPANTTAWISPHAFSAGTIIALACRSVVIQPGGMFGDSAPVSPLGPIPQAERAKLESPILTEVIDSARRNHRDERLVQAFVSVGVELWLLRNTATGERICVDAGEYEAIFGEAPPSTIPSITPSTQLEGAGEDVLTPFFEQFSAPTAGAAPSDLSSMMQRPSSRPRLGSDDADEWELVEQIVSNDRLLALTPGQGRDYGLVDGFVGDEAEMKRFLGATIITTRDRSWSEALTSFLVSWPVRLVLIVIFIVGTFIEMAAPGTGVFGAGAAVALLILIGAPWLAGMAQWWDILLVFFGLLLIAVELFLVPGTLLVGAAGAVCMLIGLVGTFVSGDMTSTEALDGIFRGMLVVFTGVVTGVVITASIARRFESSRFAQRFVLGSTVGSMRGASGASEAGATLAVGTEGVAVTDLRPAGRIKCGDSVVDAVSSGRWIESGARVRVVRSDMILEVEVIE
ncbi:MAG: hypothetical protein CMJ36_03635 [Phycisphaerae bacterium]|nr:hypothetical protein [Phycisphaerae bacterium]